MNKEIRNTISQTSLVSASKDTTAASGDHASDDKHEYEPDMEKVSRRLKFDEPFWSPVPCSGTGIGPGTRTT